MANHKVVQRVVNKKALAQPISIRYNHVNPLTKKSEDYFISTGVIVNPENFKKGIVVNCPQAAAANYKIRDQLHLLEKAIGYVVARQEEPTVAAIKAEYAANKAEYAANYVSLQDKAKRLVVDLEKLDEDDKAKLEILEQELQQLQLQVEAKQAEIVEQQKRLGVYRKTNLVALIADMIEARKKPKSQEKVVGGKRAKRTDKDAKLTKNTIAAYNTFLNVVKEWKPNLNITHVNKEQFEDFEAFCISQGYVNNTIMLFMQKFGSTMAYYSEKKYEVNENYKKYVFDLPLREEQVIYLTNEELAAFANVKYQHKNSAAVKKYEMVKDICLIMAETGLRLRDAELSKADIVNGSIEKRQAKTNGKVKIPYTDRVKAICIKNNFTFKVGNTGYFNDAFRTMLSLCTQVPSLFVETTVVNYCGYQSITETKPKWQHCSAHSLRRSAINNLLNAGYRYDQITKITGHKDFNVFQTYLDRSTDAEKLESSFEFLKPQEASE